jgi:hypothetical protein
MRAYLAGPMRSIKDFNFPAFDEAAAQLRAVGWEVVNPAEVDRARYGQDFNLSETGDLADLPDFDLAEALLADLTIIAREVDCVVVLPGWTGSLGTNAEIGLAAALGKETHTLERALQIATGFWPSTMSTLHKDPLVTDEVRTTSAKGGQKGVKLARYDLIPTEPLRLLAEHYGVGARKYDDHQYRKGYEWGKSFAAMQRHAWAFWNGEDVDAETGSLHIIAAAWHCLTLAEFIAQHPDMDDRFTGGAA